MMLVAYLQGNKLIRERVFNANVGSTVASDLNFKSVFTDVNFGYSGKNR